MNTERSTESYFNVRVVKEKNGNSCYDTISLEREDLARIITKALRADGFEASLTLITHKKTERLTWKDLRV